MKYFIQTFTALLFLACAANAQTYPAYQDTYVNDFAEVLSDAQEATLRQQLEGYDQEHGIQITVVTLQNLAAYGSADIISYTTNLFNGWGVGDATLNNGVMILLADGDRQVNIEMGAAYGHDYNDAMMGVVENQMMPEFRDSDYAGGLGAGAEHVIYALTGTTPTAPATSSTTEPAEGDKEGGSSWGIFAVIGGIIAAIGAFFGISAKRRNTAPKCPTHDVDMERLDEQADDTYLTDVQRLEERLGSRNYDVWKCPQCDQTEIREYSGSKSGFQNCPQCNARTFEGTKTVVRRASVKAEGLERTDYHCHNCGHTKTEEKTTPKVQKMDGGKSGGGGAAGEW